MKQVARPKRLLICSGLRGFTSQDVGLFITSAENLIFFVRVGVGPYRCSCTDLEQFAYCTIMTGSVTLISAG